MRSKVERASALALVATVLTALFSAQGSGAAASDLLPILVEQDPILSLAGSTPASDAVPAAGDPVFVSKPVVQALPSPEAADVEADGSDVDADSLAELVSQQVMPSALSSEMHCLASAIYFEARGESLDGQLAVGNVVINRSKSGRFPTTLCGVVKQPSQFSFVRGSSIPVAREQSQDWREAVAVAQIASAGSWKSAAKGALFFHAKHVSPNWRLTRLARVDNHIFYR